MNIYQQIKIYSATRFGVELDRLDYLTSVCKGRRILHVGCADAPLAIERINAGQLLQQRVEKVATEVIGIDISEESIQLLQENGIVSVRVMDAEQMSFDRKFEVILAGDVLEHVSNPGLFLKQIPELLEPNGELIIAVPHAFTLLALKVWLSQKESVHKDHCFYYSPKVLTQLCARYGLLPTKLSYTVQPRTTGESKLYCTFRDLLIRWRPTAAPAFIMHFKRESDIDQSQFYLLR
jgi:SAM-dependent methyltransferase